MDVKAKYMICLIGPSGSGKSTMARKIVEDCEKLEMSTVIASTDDFFIDTEGVYKFDVKMLGVNHKKNQDKVKYYANKDFPDDRKSVIIVDNTNLSVKELESYVEIGLQNDYIIRLVVPPRALEMMVTDFEKSNVHGVPIETIKRQFEKFKDHYRWGAELAKKFGVTWDEHTQSLLKEEK